MLCAGVDAGSRTVKVVLFDTARREIAAAGVRDQGVEQDTLARELFGDVLRQAGAEREQVRAIVATGYGRKLIDLADRAVTEITCQRWGTRHVMPDARTVVDIGGQDSKLLHLDPDGSVTDFVMNDRCAAGTGRFLEVLATRLNIKLGALGELASRSTSPAIISSMCVVFAETEIVGLLASGISREDIACGVQMAVASRVAAMAGGEFSEPVVFTGGVALIPSMDAALAAALGKPVAVVAHPQLTAALGAALVAAEACE